jgi:hypothetical protein
MHRRRQNRRTQDRADSRGRARPSERALDDWAGRRAIGRALPGDCILRRAAAARTPPGFRALDNQAAGTAVFGTATHSN